MPTRRPALACSWPPARREILEFCSSWVRTAPGVAYGVAKGDRGVTAGPRAVGTMDSQGTVSAVVIGICLGFRTVRVCVCVDQFII